MRVVTRWVLGLGFWLSTGNLHPDPARAQGVPREFREVHLGMEMRIVVVHADAERAAALARRAFDAVEVHEAILSDWRAQSEIRRLEFVAPGEWVPISPPLRDVLAVALEVARASAGAFDPTVGPLTALWREARETGRPIDEARRAAALARVGFQLVELDSVAGRVRFRAARMRLDLGAVAKGWILDEALRLLIADGACAALVEAGGDLVVHGAPPASAGWRIRVPRPSGDTVLVLTAGAVSTSGASAQWIVDAAGRTESHVLDPRTGRGSPGDGVVTVVGPRGALADALATALALTPSAERAPLAAKVGVTLLTPTTR